MLPPLPLTIKVTEEAVAILEARCASVKEALRTLPVPWVVEFAGLPRAGKSTCIAAIVHLFRRNGISVLAPVEGAGLAPEHLKADLVAYNAWTALYAIQQVLEGSVRSADPQRVYDMVLLDRGLFDATAWLHYFDNRKELEEENHRKKVADFLRLEKWSKPLRQVFVFYCSPEEAVKRELFGKLSAKPGRILAEERLIELRAAYNQARECYEDDFEIATVETDGADNRDIAYSVTRHIFDAIEKGGAQ